METIKNTLTSLHEIGLWPEVLLCSLGAYFIARWWLDVGPRKSQFTPLIAALTAMFAFVWPHSPQDALLNLVRAVIHSFLAIGLYSWAEKRGWVDRLGDLIEKKFFPPKDPPEVRP